MWRSKKFILIALLAAVVLVGGTVGAVFAQTGNGDDSQPESRHGTLLNRVCEIYEENTGAAIDPQKLEDAFAQARSEMREAALDSRLQYLVDQGKITQEQATQYKAWLQGRPDMSQFRQQLKEWQQVRPGMPPELEEWQQARPDVPLRDFGFRGHGGGSRGWGGPCPMP